MNSKTTQPPAEIPTSNGLGPTGVPPMTADELSRLTPEQKLERIAALLGWTCKPHRYYRDRIVWEHTDGRRAASCDLPDWFGDLNAMYEVEETLQGDHQWQYCHALARICCGAMESIHARADQRADAFLLTVGARPTGPNPKLSGADAS